jgi:hypothetical protein
MTRVEELYAAERQRYEGAVTTVHVDADKTANLEKAAAAVRAAR